MSAGSAPRAALALEDGLVVRGSGFGAVGESLGELVFATGMTGYQETLTDPSYRRQIVMMTAPHVGITGMNDEDDESRRIWVAGYVVRDPARIASSWRATGTLDARLRDAGVVGVAGVDTRALTRRIRTVGVMRAGVFSGDAAARPDTDLVAAVAAGPEMRGAALADEVTTAEPYVVRPVGPVRFRVAAIDLGIKRMTPTMMAARGIEVHVLPARATTSELEALAVDGLFLSNGPGDPATADHAVELVRWALGRRLPVFGICFGNQILGRALGLSTYKLRFGHRGINQPVKDLRSGRVAITSQNHGFAVEAHVGDVIATAFGRAEVSHVSLNDGVVEGLRCLDVPAFSVQYHPEAAAGPHDAEYLFDEFVGLLQRAQGGGSHATAP